ncbi:hypothetical protein PFISCL1PPCAC_4472, partial [Pristionchus fissidentatus]
DVVVAPTMVITGGVLLYVTLPLHSRLLYVLLRPNSKTGLDNSFHTLMINTTIVNLIFALDCCLILEPSASGVFFEFYDGMGYYFAKIEMIKSTVLLLIGSVLHLVLAVNRFSAISFPLQHQRWWRGRKLFWFCVATWSIGFCFCVPLLFPGTTGHTVRINKWKHKAVEYTFIGEYYLVYSMGCSFSGSALEIIALIFYIGMLFKFHHFRKYTKSGAAEVKRMTRGVLRTTLAALCISVGMIYHIATYIAGSWILVLFMLFVYISYWTAGVPLIYVNNFSGNYRFLNAVNNVLTPWTMLVAFNNV